MSRLTSDRFDLAAAPLQTKTLPWPDGKAMDPREEQLFDSVKQRWSCTLTQ